MGSSIMYFLFFVLNIRDQIGCKEPGLSQGGAVCVGQTLLTMAHRWRGRGEEGGQVGPGAKRLDGVTVGSR